MLRLFLIVTLAAAATLALAGSGRATFPGRNGRIVFASARTDRPGEGNSEIYELDLANGRSRDLSRTIAYDDTEFAVSPDGTRVAFLRAPISNPDAFSHPDASHRQLWVMGRDGSDQHRLFDVDFYGTPGIVWSGDGRRIAFLAASGANTANHLWVVDADGSGLRELTDFPTAGPRWSPDRSELAFVGWTNGPGWDIGFIGANGTGLRWLPTPAGTDIPEGALPSWSPDGEELVFFRVRAEGEDLVLVGADGSGARTLTTVTDIAGRGLSDLQWLPSGEIGFLEPSSGHVELIRPDGTGLQTVADGVTSPVAWSPTGDRLAFVRNPNGQVPRRELVVEPLHGPERALSLPGLLARVWPELSGGPAWSPSGESLYVAGTVAPHDSELFSITPQGGDLRQLTRDNVNAGVVARRAPDRLRPAGHRLRPLPELPLRDGRGRQPPAPADEIGIRKLAVLGARQRASRLRPARPRCVRDRRPRHPHAPNSPACVERDRSGLVTRRPPDRLRILEPAAAPARAPRRRWRAHALRQSSRQGHTTGDLAADLVAARQLDRLHALRLRQVVVLQRA